jgi:hypothetical protein
VYIKHRYCNYSSLINSKGFWQCCIALEIIVFLDFVHPLMFLKNTTFRKRDLFLSSGKIMMAPTLSLDQWLRLGFSKWPSRVGTAIILPEDGNRSSFWNVFFKKHYTMDKVQKYDSSKYSSSFSSNICDIIDPNTVHEFVYVN